MHRSTPLLTACVAVAIGLSAGCGPSPGDVLSEHRAGYIALRQKLARLAEKMPPSGTVRDQPPAAPLSPELVLSTREVAGNAEAMMAELLTDDAAKPEFDLGLSENLATALFWTSEGNKTPRDGDVAFMRRTLAAGLACKYLVVHRVAELKLPEAASNREFRPGRIAIEGIVFDVEQEEIVATYTAQAESDELVEFSVRPDEDEQDRLAQSARSTVWSNIRRQIGEKLESVAGGRAAIE